MYLYSIEGTDKSGKETQTKLVLEKLTNILSSRGILDKFSINKISYPKYESDSSFLVKEFLDKKFGELDTIDTRMTSLFYAVDRCHDYHTFIKPNLDDSKINVFISDRYTGSNLIHQGASLTSIIDICDFIGYNESLEYNVCKIPRPKLTFFLDVPPEFSTTLRKNEKLKNGRDTDILEENKEHMFKAYTNAKFIATHCNWITIKCTETKDDIINFRDKEDISDEIVQFILTDLYKLGGL